MMSLGPILFGSNSTIALPVARATEADLMPLLVTNVRSMRLTQDEQLIPVTCMLQNTLIYHTTALIYTNLACYNFYLYSPVSLALCQIVQLFYISLNGPLVSMMVSLSIYHTSRIIGAFGNLLLAGS